MNQQWYYALNGQQQGPVSEDAIRKLISDNIIDGETTLLFSQGMENWQPISEIEAFQASPPPSAATQAYPPVTISPNPVATASSSTSEPQQYAFGQFPKDEATPKKEAAVNPYATPSSGLTAAPSNITPGQEIEPGSQKLEIGACITRAWALTKRHYGTLFLSMIVYGIALVIFSTVGSFFIEPAPIPETTQQTEELSFLNVIEELNKTLSTSEIIFNFVFQIFSMFLNLGFIRIGLNIVKGDHANVSLLFSESGKLFTSFISTLIYFLIVGLGFLFFVIPGIYLAYRYSFYQYAIVDKDLGPIEALSYSFRLTKGNVLNLFGLSIMIFLIGLAGVLAFLVGLFVAVPVIFLSLFVAYHYLQYGKEAALNNPEPQGTF